MRVQAPSILGQSGASADQAPEPMPPSSAVTAGSSVTAGSAGHTSHAVDSAATGDGAAVLELDPARRKPHGKQ